MKKILTLSLLIFSISVHAQWVEETNGTDITTTDKVGIGTSAPLSNAVINGGSVNDIIWPLWVQNSRNSSTISNYGVGIKLKHSHNGELTKWSGIASIQEGPWANLSGLALYSDQVERVRIKYNGNVGIGTTNPSFKLHINASDNQLMRFTSTNGTWLDFESKNASAGSRIWSIGHFGTSNKFGIYQRDGTDQYRFAINTDGNVGIGTTSPNAKLDIKGTGDGAEVLRLSTERAWTFKQRNTGSTSQLDLHSTVGDKFFNITSINGIKVARFFTSSELEKNKVFLVPEGGQVGVGTTTTGTHKLAVDGTIGAREIKVELGSWSDFVFASDYKLPSLDEVEEFIAQNNHLPEIPSEAEVLEEGINLGEMNAKLLQKIEELTLYLIEQNKRIITLEKKIVEKE